MKNSLQNLFVALALFSALNLQPSTAFAQGTAFTYQGRLNGTNGPVSGSYDLTFALFNTNTTGVAVAGPITNSATSISSGLFLVTLDFGGVFTGSNYWLEIGVRTNGNGAFTTLAPRQAVTPTPYAIFAEGASNVLGVVPGGGLSGSYSSAVTLNNTANSFNGVYAGNGGGLTNVNAATLNGLTSGSLWQLGGNNVTPGKFLGSTNNQPVEIWVNNQRVAQLGYAFNAVYGYSPNVVLGHSGNFVNSGVVGATIIGGGSTNGLFSPSTNQVSGNFATVVGGYGNSASGNYSVAMGFRANASGSQSTALGGASATGDYSTAAGNSGASGKFSTAMGSSGASLEADTAMGVSSASGGGSTALGYSTASGVGSTAAGQSTATGGYSTAMGSSTASGYSATAIGINSTASGQYSTAMGQSTATNVNSTAMGASVANGQNSTAVGQSIATNLNATALGASFAYGVNSTAMGAATASGSQSTAMGYGKAMGIDSTALGQSTAVGDGSTAMGNSIAGGTYSTAMGVNNDSSGNNSVAMGYGNIASGDNSFAGGAQANANYRGNFVWADSQGTAFNSTDLNQFCIRAQGGVILDNSTPAINFGNQTRQMLDLYQTGYGIGVQNYTEYFRSGSGFAWFQGGVHSDTQNYPGAGGIVLMELESNGSLYILGTLSQASDRSLKGGFEPVVAKDILEKVATLPISRWHYTNDVTTPHLGPMAQDFYAAFNIGPDDKHITTVDESGVALAAIQGLNQKLNEKESEIQNLKRQNGSLAQRLSELETVVKQLTTQK